MALTFDTDHTGCNRWRCAGRGTRPIGSGCVPAMAMAQPRPGTVRNAAGAPCPAAERTDYPLTATCTCGADLHCADGTADWCHTHTGQGRCA